MTNSIIDRLQAAINDAASVPSAADLAAAPILNNYILTATSDDRPVVIGEVSGHPGLDDGFIASSAVVAINAAEGYMRTQSRWYRLGLAMKDAKVGDLSADALQTYLVATIVYDDMFDAMVGQELALLGRAVADTQDA
jgi:hypothetical protein